MCAQVFQNGDAQEIGWDEFYFSIATYILGIFCFGLEFVDRADFLFHALVAIHLNRQFTSVLVGVSKGREAGDLRPG
ncbi:MAG: hypothetical protein FJ217_08670 [Ignavibacteria bacterium]|nr:hypothetical protein [Ignavibacteria bacterium]